MPMSGRSRSSGTLGALPAKMPVMPKASVHGGGGEGGGGLAGGGAGGGTDGGRRGRRGRRGWRRRWRGLGRHVGRLVDLARLDVRRLGVVLPPRLLVTKLVRGLQRRLVWVVEEALADPLARVERRARRCRGRVWRGWFRWLGRRRGRRWRGDGDGLARRTRRRGRRVAAGLLVVEDAWQHLHAAKIALEPRAADGGARAVAARGDARARRRRRGWFR